MDFLGLKSAILAQIDQLKRTPIKNRAEINCLKQLVQTNSLNDFFKVLSDTPHYLSLAYLAKIEAFFDLIEDNIPEFLAFYPMEYSRAILHQACVLGKATLAMKLILMNWLVISYK